MPNIKEVRSHRSDFNYIYVDEIEMIPNWNVRQETEDLQAHIRGLATSIRHIGVQDALTVFIDANESGKTKAFIIDGHNRFKAVCLVNEEDRQAGRETTIKSVPCYVKTNMSEADRTLQMLVRNSGKPLTPIEIALVFQRLHEAFGWSVKEIADKGNVSVGDVYAKLALANAPSELIELIQSGVVSSSLVQSTIREHGEDAASQLINQAVLSNGNGKITKKTINNIVAKNEANNENEGLNDNGNSDDNNCGSSRNGNNAVRNPYKNTWQLASQLFEECEIMDEDEDDEGDIIIKFPKVFYKELKPYLRNK